MARLASLLVVILGVVVACGPSEQGSAPTTTTVEVATTSTPKTTSSSVQGAAAVDSTTTTLAIQRYEITDGEFQGPETFTVPVGGTFEIEVVSDAVEELHVHGFDLVFELEPGEPTLVTFTASAPGIFEVELHGSHSRLFEVEVTG